MIRTKREFEKIINELEEILMDEQRNVENKISHRAPQSFYDEMNGCLRGISMAKSKAINFLKAKLLE